MAVEVRQQHNHILQTRFPAEKIIPATHQSNPNKPPRVAQLIKFNLSGETTITTTPTSKKGKGKGKAEQRLIPREGVKSPVTMPWQPYSRILDESQSAVLAFADQCESSRNSKSKFE
jgi:hypothetical protein